ncbi:MAG: hypothetical protein OSA98_18815 [Rubripirellula sp.]|nr:hypothetical protein [Rubripirellula sp.]
MIALFRILLLNGFVLLGALTAGALAAQSEATRPDLGEENIQDASEDLRDILKEQAELRRDLKMLNQHVDHLKRRLESLDQISEAQQQLDRLRKQLDRAESTGNEADSRELESKLEPFERRFDQMRESMEIDTEFHDRITEVRELKERLDALPKTETATRSSRHLTIAIDNLRKLQKIRADLRKLGPTSEDRHDQLEQAADELQEQIDFDSELTELGFRFIEAVEDDQDEELEKLTDEIRDILDEMEGQPQARMTIPPSASNSNGQRTAENESVASGGQKSVLESGQYYIRQSWSQETDYPRPYLVNVPKGKQGQKFPVFIFLHGNGGNAKEVMPILLRNRRKMASQYIMVFAQGYQESWNIVSERSKADDKGFIEAIVLKLASYNNVQKDHFSIMGVSNGAALVNQLLIESKLPNIRSYISGVSPLNVWQYDGEYFKSKGSGNDYRKPTKPMTGKRLMNISGTNDELVPYEGGISNHIPAKDRKLGFVAAEESTYLWARQMGDTGEKLTEPSRTEGQLEVFSYLGGDVIHYKVVGAGHGATHEVSEDILLNFLQGGEEVVEK